MPNLAPASVGDRKTLVFEILRTRIGPHRALTAQQIGKMIGITAREVRRLITELIVIDDQGEICANTGDGQAFPGSPRGYFWASSPEDLEAYRAVLISRLDEMRKRAHAAWQAMHRLRHGGNLQPRLIP